MRRIAPIAAFCLLAPLAGCIYAGGRTVREVGPQITEESLAFVEPGATTVELLVAAFGEPYNRVCLRDGTEVLRYDCDVRTTEGSYVLMLFASSSNTIERTCWWFETRDGLVARYWGEKLHPSEIVAPRPAQAAGQAEASANAAVTLDGN